MYGYLCVTVMKGGEVTSRGQDAVTRPPRSEPPHASSGTRPSQLGPLTVVIVIIK